MKEIVPLPICFPYWSIDLRSQELFHTCFWSQPKQRAWQVIYGQEIFLFEKLSRILGFHHKENKAVRTFPFGHRRNRKYWASGFWGEQKAELSAYTLGWLLVLGGSVILKSIFDIPLLSFFLIHIKETKCKERLFSWWIDYSNYYSHKF